MAKYRWIGYFLFSLFFIRLNVKKNLMGPETQRDERIEINFVKILSGNLILEYLNAYYCSLTLWYIFYYFYA